MCKRLMLLISILLMLAAGTASAENVYYDDGNDSHLWSDFDNWTDHNYPNDLVRADNVRVWDGAALINITPDVNTPLFDQFILGTGAGARTNSRWISSDGFGRRGVFLALTRRR